MAPSFGLPLPAEGAATGWWLRPKGVRDVVAGVLVLAVFAAGGHHALGLVLLIKALIPIGDMTTVLAAKGRTATALGGTRRHCGGHDRCRARAAARGVLMLHLVASWLLAAAFAGGAAIGSTSTSAWRAPLVTAAWS